MLNDHLLPAIQSYLDETGGGMATGFVAVVDLMSPEGEQGSLILSTMEGQRTVLSLGMVEYARECFAADARDQMNACACELEDGE